jgi:hypothetical protein
MEDVKVLPVRCRRVLGHQGVISNAKYARWEQLLPIAIVGKCSRLPHQPVDDVPVVHLALVSAAEPRQTVDELLGVPHFQAFRAQTHLDLLTNQPAGHHITVPLDMNHAARVDTTLQALIRFQSPRRQRSQNRHFLGEPLTPAGVEPRLEFVQKSRVGVAIGKVAAAPEHQRLIHRLLEAPMPLLDVAILVGMGCLNLLPNKSVMFEQSLVTPRELFALGGVIHRQAHPIGPMPRWHAAELPQSVLQTFAEALETL